MFFNIDGKVYKKECISQFSQKAIENGLSLLSLEKGFDQPK